MSEYVGPFDKILSRVSAFDAATDSHVIQSARRFEKEILNMNKEFQLYEEGELSDGSSLPDYKQATVAYKIEAGQRYSNMTLSDSWDFYEHFYIEWGRDEFKIWSNSENTEKIFAYLKKKKYKEPQLVFGLTDENLDFLIREKIRPVLAQRFATFLFA